MEAISALILLTVFTSACWNPVVFGADDASNDVNSALCGVDLRPFLPLPYNTLPNIVCKPLWNSFFLRVSLIFIELFLNNYWFWFMNLSVYINMLCHSTPGLQITSSPLYYLLHTLLDGLVWDFRKTG